MVHVADWRDKTLLHVNKTLYYTIHMHIYWARKYVLKEMFDGASKKRIGLDLCIDSMPM